MATVISRLKAQSTPSEDVLARIKEAAKYPVTLDQELREFQPVNPALHANPAYFKSKKKTDHSEN